MSTGLPYPLSNNRASYHSSDAQHTYHSAPANPQYPYSSFPARSTSFDTNHGRLDPASTPSSLSGMFHHAEQDPQQHYSRAGHPADAFSQPQAQVNPRDQVWQYPQQVADVPRTRLDHPSLEMHIPREYQNTMSHSSQAVNSSHGHNMAASPSSPSTHQQTGPSVSRSRREKPRLELAPDQPLTTQGKPRTRVYVACVQCRGRKIRCDGTKPVCYNCSRRTENPHMCTYDAAPKRRGPDRVPGARQRSVASTNERPPRRRRRPPPPEGTHDLFVASQSASASPVDHKSNAFGPTTQNFMTHAAPSHSENLTIIQEVGPGQYSRYRQSLPGGRSSVSENVSVHYAQSHNLSVPSHTPAAASEALPLGSPGTPGPIGYSVDMSHPSGLPSMRITGSRGDYGYGETRATERDQKMMVIGTDPGLQFTRETWWDALLVLYASEGDGGALYDLTLGIPPGVRETTTASITADLRSIFRASPHWFHFINLPRFFGSLLDPRARHSIQPSLILGAVALSTFFRSHEGELGARGRDRALKMRDQAQSALEASLNSRWIDHGLVQAAWLLAFFEICAHPLHSTTRVRSSMGMLDSLLRSMKLLSLDADNPCASVFTTGVPTIPPNPSTRMCQLSAEEIPISQTARSSATHPSIAIQAWYSADDPQTSISAPLDSLADPQVFSPHSDSPTPPFPYPHLQGHPSTVEPTCNCKTFTLGHSWAMVQEFAPLWDMTPTWQSEWTESDIRKEECRRLVWSSVMLSAGHSAYTAARSEQEVQQLFLMDPRNYALLFPGESLVRAHDSPAVPPPSKDSVWALYMRAMLLWNSCIRMRTDASLPDTDKAQFALTAWSEIDAIEEALGRHTCSIERAFLFQGRELLFSSRMCIAYEFQRCLPQPTAHANLLFYRRKAEEWLQHQAILAKRLLHTGLHSVTGLPAADLAKRPFLLFWFMSLMERALTLWSYDPSLVFALDVAKALSRLVEYLMTLWPCSEQRRRWEELYEKLNNSCYAASGPVQPTVPALPSG